MNNYLTFSFGITLPSQEVANEVTRLLGLETACISGTSPDVRVRSLAELLLTFKEYEQNRGLGFEWAINDNELYISADENGDTEQAAELIVWLLPKLDCKSVGFTYAEHSGRYNGGGAVLAFKDGTEIGTKWINAEEWLRQEL